MDVLKLIAKNSYKEDEKSSSSKETSGLKDVLSKRQPGSIVT